MRVIYANIVGKEDWCVECVQGYRPCSHSSLFPISTSLFISSLPRSSLLRPSFPISNSLCFSVLFSNDSLLPASVSRLLIVPPLLFPFFMERATWWIALYIRISTALYDCDRRDCPSSFRVSSRVGAWSVSTSLQIRSHELRFLFFRNLRTNTIDCISSEINRRKQFQPAVDHDRIYGMKGMQFLQHLPAFLNRQVPGNGRFIGRYSIMGPRAIAAKMAKILGDDAFTACFVESRLESASHGFHIKKHRW